MTDDLHDAAHGHWAWQEESRAAEARRREKAADERIDRAARDDDYDEANATPASAGGGGQGENDVRRQVPDRSNPVPESAANYRASDTPGDPSGSSFSPASPAPTAEAVMSLVGAFEDAVGNYWHDRGAEYDDFMGRFPAVESTRAALSAAVAAIVRERDDEYTRVKYLAQEADTAIQALRTQLAAAEAERERYDREHLEKLTAEAERDALAGKLRMLEQEHNLVLADLQQMSGSKSHGLDCTTIIGARWAAATAALAEARALLDAAVNARVAFNGWQPLDAQIAAFLTAHPAPGGVPCLRCHGTGVIDAPYSGSDPSCPDCDGEAMVEAPPVAADKNTGDGGMPIDAEGGESRSATGSPPASTRAPADQPAATAAEVMRLAERWTEVIRARYDAPPTDSEGFKLHAERARGARYALERKVEDLTRERDNATECSQNLDISVRTLSDEACALRSKLTAAESARDQALNRAGNAAVARDALQARLAEAERIEADRATRTSLYARQAIAAESALAEARGLLRRALGYLDTCTYDILCPQIKAFLSSRAGARDEHPPRGGQPVSPGEPKLSHGVARTAPAGAGEAGTSTARSVADATKEMRRIMDLYKVAARAYKEGTHGDLAVAEAQLQGSIQRLAEDAMRRDGAKQIVHAYRCDSCGKRNTVTVAWKDGAVWLAGGERAAPLAADGAAVEGLVAAAGVVIGGWVQERYIDDARIEALAKARDVVRAQPRPGAAVSVEPANQKEKS